MRVFLLFLTVCGGLLAPWPVMAQAPIPPASVVRFNTLCATCHEGECSARLSFRLDPGATDSHIRRYTGDITQQTARELNALLEHMKQETFIRNGLEVSFIVVDDAAKVVPAALAAMEPEAAAKAEDMVLAKF